MSLFQYRPSEFFSSRLRALVFLVGVALLAGCDSSNGNFVVTNDNAAGQTFNLRVAADPAALARSEVRAQIGTDSVQFRVTVFDLNANQVAQQTVPRGGFAVFPLPQALYLIRFEGLDATANVVGYFDRVVFVDADRTTLIPGLVLDPNPPVVVFPGANAQPFLLFKAAPTALTGGDNFSVTARVYDGQGNSVTSPVSGVTLTSQTLPFSVAPPPASTDANGEVTFNVSFPVTSNGTTTLTVAANGVSSATSAPLVVTSGAVSFTAAPDSPYTAPPSSIVFVTPADLDGSNGPDLVVADLRNVTVLLNDGDGSFTKNTSSPHFLDLAVQSVAVGDFDGMNGLDLAAVKNTSSGLVTLLLNDGTGNFTTHGSFSGGGDALSIVSADFDGLNGPDLAVGNVLVNRVTIFLNNGGSPPTFTNAGTTTTGSRPAGLVVADFDGMNGPDLAVLNAGAKTVTVLLNNGPGATFTEAGGSPYPTGDIAEVPQAISVGDLDGTNGPDLVVSNEGSDSVTVLLNNGSASFTQPNGSPFATGDGPRTVTVGDFDGRNGPDLATANISGGDVTVLLNDGNGVFSQAAGSPLMAGSGPFSVAAGNFDLLRSFDLAVGNFFDKHVTVLLNDR